MDPRTILAVALSLGVILVFQYFFGYDDKQPPPDEVNIEHTQAPSGDLRGQTAGPGHETGIRPDMGSPTHALTPLVGSDIQADTKAPQRKARDITVETDLYRLVFSEQGGTIKKCLLKKYRLELSAGSLPVDLVTVTPPHLPLGLRVESQPPIDLATRLFEADREKLELTEAEEEAQIKFVCNLGNGVKVTRIYTFYQESYWIDMSVELTGAGNVPTTLSLYNLPGELASRFTFTFVGPAYYTGTELHEVELDDIGERHAYTGPVDWMGYGDKYFLSALIPVASGGLWNILIEKKDVEGLTESRLTMLKPATQSTGQEGEVLRLGLYFGPKEIDFLNSMGHNLSKAINFGWFDPIAKPLLYILKFLYKYLKNYGFAIIVVTIFIKIVFWPLAQKSAKSMKTMQKLQPKMAKLKEKYGKDKEKMNKELMQLYKTYKVNPLGGCLPMLLQIPVFFALYKVLLQSIELRHAPFMLWINDLSSPDRLMIPGVDIPYLGGIPILTILMGASMYLQQKLSPSSLDPTQARMMQFLPLIFTFMFINFPSGLVLYWLINNLLSIAQQHYVNKYTT